MPEALLLEEALEGALLAASDVREAAPPATATRRFGLHVEACYILDCAVELGEITPLEDMVFRVKNTASLAFVDMTDRDEGLPAHWLRNTARQFLDSLPLEDRYVWALRALPGMEMGVRMFQERVEFLVKTKVQSDLGIEERTSIKFLDEATPAMFSNKLFSSVHDVTQARVQEFVAAEYAETKARMEEDLRVVQDALEWVSQPGNRERARAIASRLFEEVPHVESDTATGAITVRRVLNKVGAQRKTQRRARSAIKKALRLFSRTGLEDSVRMMVSGREVELSHPDSPFKFVLQPLQAGWLEQKTVAPGLHVPYQLSLLTKEDVFLSRLCVLFDETPVLDQLLALTFFVQSGNEEDILSKANWFGYESSARLRSILQEKAPTLLPKVPEHKKGTDASGLFGGLADHWRTETHWDPYRGPVKSWIASWMGELCTALPTTARTVALV
jgi:hypothetical protein